jgi:hypothetical protein
MSQEYLKIHNLKIQFAIFQLDNEISVLCNSHPTVYQHTTDSDSRSQLLSIDCNSGLVEIQIAGKGPNDTKVDSNGVILFDARVEIEKVWINNMLLKNWAVSKLYNFYPTYSEDQKKYAIDHALPLREWITEETSFHYNGCVVIDLENFLSKYHEILQTKLTSSVSWISSRTIDKPTLEELEYILQNI